MLNTAAEPDSSSHLVSNRKIPMTRPALCAGALLLVAASIPGFAQDARVTSASKVFMTGKIGFFSKTSEYKVEARSNDLSLYTGYDTFLFDPKTFAMVHVAAAAADFDARIKATPTAGQLDVGNVWQASYRQPPASSARCLENSEQDMTATVKSKERATLKIDGRDQEVEVVLVAISGTWTSCANSGDWTASRTYAPALGLLVAGESVSLFQGKQVGGGSFVLHHLDRQ
jgi:hypothetical protein